MSLNHQPENGPTGLNVVQLLQVNERIGYQGRNGKTVKNSTERGLGSDQKVLTASKKA